MASLLQRETFRTSRLLEFFPRNAVTSATIGRRKKVIDKVLDTAEDAAIASAIDVVCIAVRDSGAGLPPNTGKAVLDFSVSVSTRSEGAFCAAHSRF
jgi:hypothetical protein